jgi:hypothetical protein
MAQFQSLAEVCGVIEEIVPPTIAEDLQRSIDLMTIQGETRLWRDADCSRFRILQNRVCNNPKLRRSGSRGSKIAKRGAAELGCAKGWASPLEVWTIPVVWVIQRKACLPFGDIRPRIGESLFPLFSQLRSEWGTRLLSGRETETRDRIVGVTIDNCQ